MNEATSQIQKAEPPFWWSGMQRPELEILFYGEDISDFQPVSDEVQILKIERTANPNYLFVTLDGRDQQAGEVEFRFEKEGANVFSHKYEFRKRAEGSATRKGFDSSDLIYLIMPDRFANGDPSTDSHPEMHEKANRTDAGGRHGGDLQGIIERLDYIESLGATAIWNTPVCEDNDPQGSYHGYAQSNVYRIDPRHGTNEDYVRLSAELHKRNMKLIMDYVTNHWGLEHWILKDPPTADWIHQFPEYTQTNHKMTTQFDPNAAKSDLENCVQGWFVPTMPDLNQSNQKVLNYLIQNAIWWIEYAGLDGLRVDTYSYNEKHSIAQWTRAIMDEYPNFNIVGEIWMHHQAQIAYWQRNSKIGEIQNYNSHLPSVMDFTLHDAITEVFDEEEPQWNSGMVKIYENFVNDFLYPDIDNMLVFAENHDTPRINEIYPNIEDYKLIMSLIATIRGIPQIYYGSEIGMKGKKSEGDGDIRRDFPGGWEGDENNAFDSSGRHEIQSRYFDFSSRLFNWRKSSEVIHRGKTTQYAPYDNVYVYFRTLEEETVMVVINPNNTEVELSLDRFTDNLAAYSAAIDVLGGESKNLDGSWNLPVKTAYILELKK